MIRRDRNSAKAGVSRIAILLLTAWSLLGWVSPAQAINCTDLPNGTLDGFAGQAPPSQIQIDRNCTIRNYPSGLPTNFSFQNTQADPGPWLVIFDNVAHTGQMACDAVHENKIWFVNGSFSGIQPNCQNKLIPVEKIDKQNPAGQSTAAIGVPFTYDLIIPVLFDPATGTVIDTQGSATDLHGITVTDDLNETGVDLSYLSHTVKWQDTGVDVPHTFSNVGGLLTFEFGDLGLIVPAGEQFVIAITVVLEDTPANAPGTQFFNTAKWDFGRLICDDVNDPSTCQFFEPLPGEWGISPPLTIAAPDLVMTKTGPASLGLTLNLGQFGQFTLDLQNTGLSDAWDVTILDRMPDDATGGTCDLTPEILSAQVFQADGSTPVPGKGPLVQGTDFSFSYSAAPTCELTLSMLTPAAAIGPGERLIVTYQTQLDADTQEGATLTNVAGATQWFNGDSGNPNRLAFDRTLSDGTPGVADHEDEHTVTAALFGYFFEKTVENRNSGANPALTAAPGDVLRYTLRLQTTDLPLTGLSFLDDMGELNASPVFVPGSLDVVSFPGTATNNTVPNAGTNNAGVLDVSDIDVPASSEVLVVFDITVDPTLPDGTVITNQATLSDTGELALSDDPNVNGQADPTVDGDEDPTVVVVQTPPALPLEKLATQATATIGETFSYQITVPETPATIPLYDVRILDDLGASAADLVFVSVSKVSPGGSWTPVNTGTPTNLVIEGQGGGIDIGVDEQITVAITVMLADTPTNVAGLSFDNTADYTYNGLNDDPASQLPGAPGTSGPMTVVEPDLTLLKSGPAQMTPGTPDSFVLDVQNIGDSSAWELTITDQLPNGATGGTCDVAPSNFVAQVFESNGSTPVSGVLAEGSDYSVSWSGDPLCRFTLSVLTAAGSIGPGQRLIISYQTELDADSQNGVLLTNVAGATEWFNGDASISGRRTYTRTLTDGTPGALDHEDEHTVEVLTNVPSLFAAKNVALLVDNGTPNVVDPLDVLRYTITITNSGGVAATGVTLADSVPANTSYVPDSLTLNGIQIPGVASPLVAGLPISSSDLTPPLPGAGLGTLSSGETAVIQFDLEVDAGTPGGTVISNQALVGSVELPGVLTDGDGNPATGPEPTVVIVGAGQQLVIAKQVQVVGGGPALPGSTLEYTVTVTNIALVPALDVVITDDLDPAELSYVSPSASLDGVTAGISFAGTVITANYGTAYGPLPPNASTVLRFRADVAPGLNAGDTVTNTGVVTWDTPQQMAQASVSIDVGGVVGEAALNGAVWHDVDFDDLQGGTEQALAGWSVELYQGGALIQSVVTDAAGAYQFTGLAPNDAGGTPYELRFGAPGAGAATASLGTTASAFTNGPQQITDIVAGSGASLQALNLPIDPNGVVYDALLRAPVAGATLTLLSGGAPVPAGCFDDPAQQGQVTLGQGWYKFDLNFSDAAACPASGGNYLVAVTPPGGAFAAGPSQILPPSSDGSTPALLVPSCPGSANDALPLPAGFCEAQASASAPASGDPTPYFLHLFLDASQVPGSSQIFNNHVPVDPVLNETLAITKTTPSANVVRGQIVPYEITVGHDLGVVVTDVSIVDRFPAGFSYVEGSARIDGLPVEPTQDGRELLWSGLTLPATGRTRLVVLLAVGAGVTDGKYVNRAQALSSLVGDSGEATATVRIVPDPTFSCTDVIGKVFDDANRNGVQDPGERGLPGVRLATTRGLAAITDQHGRYHITCAAIPNESRGSNFTLKLDDRTLPSGYRMATRQLQVQRATRGKTLRLNYAASIHRVVGLDLADAVFEPGTVEMRLQWRPRLELLLEELAKAPSTLRLSYVADLEDPQLVEERLAVVKDEIRDSWKGQGHYELEIESEIFWRLGAPPAAAGGRR